LTEKLETLLLFVTTTTVMFFNPFVGIALHRVITTFALGLYRQVKNCLKLKLEWQVKYAGDNQNLQAQPVMVKYRLHYLAQPLLNISAKSFNCIIWSLIKGSGFTIRNTIICEYFSLNALVQYMDKETCL
jgi:MFS superfamily sulfate permease-like transporter